MKREPTSTQDKPVLEERAFQKLLAAAYILQQHRQRLFVMKAKTHPSVLYEGAIAVNGERFRATRLTSGPTAKPITVQPLRPALAPNHPDLDPLASKCDSVLPLETAHQLSVLASRLEALLRQDTRIQPASNVENQIEIPVVPVKEPLPDRSSDVSDLAEVEQEAVSSLQPSEPVQPVTPVETAASSGTNVLRSGSMRRMFQSNQFFWMTALVLATGSVCGLLLSAWGNRVSPLPSRLSQPSEVVQQSIPFQKPRPVTTAPAPHRKAPVTSSHLNSANSDTADAVAKDTVRDYKANMPAPVEPAATVGGIPRPTQRHSDADRSFNRQNISAK